MIDKPIDPLIDKLIDNKYIYTSYQNLSLLFYRHYIYIYIYIQQEVQYPLVIQSSYGKSAGEGPPFINPRVDQGVSQHLATEKRGPHLVAMLNDLVGGSNHLEKYESQWEGLCHIL